MKRVIITKDQIIEALQTENLAVGSWVFQRGFEFCEVCAIGACLRYLGYKKKQIENIGSFLQRNLKENGIRISEMATENDVELLFKGNCFMGALSAYFEGVAKGNREETIAFVKKRFPNKLDITKVVSTTRTIR